MTQGKVYFLNTMCLTFISHTVKNTEMKYTSRNQLCSQNCIYYFVSMAMDGAGKGQFGAINHRYFPTQRAAI